VTFTSTLRAGLRTPSENGVTGPGRAAAALRRRWPTGVGIAATAAASLLLAAVPDDLAFVVSAWCVLLAAVIYLTWGVRRAHLSPNAGRRGEQLLTAQTAAVLVFGALAISAVGLDRETGTYLLAAGWLGHAAWDVAHHWMNAVVPRWYAETCLVADVLVASSLLAPTAL
jgi:hypothetical protein